MKKYLLVVSFFSLGFSWDVYTPNYADDMKTLEPYWASFDSIARTFSLDPVTVTSLGSPEVGRYWELRDRAETEANEYLYVHLGSANGANYSINVFQMKPSCAEQLEDSIRMNPALSSFLFLTEFTSRDTIAIRTERLNRLKDPVQQFIYLCAFWTLMEHRFQYRSFETMAEKIRFYASAYNLGVSARESTIDWWGTVSAFPYGRDNLLSPLVSFRNVPYADIAVTFFELYSDSVTLK